MMEKPYLSPQLIEFIQENMDRDLAELALEAKKYPDMSMPFVIDQIYGRRKAKLKLPTWFAHDEVIYPPKISMEQCSSEQTAAFKASILKGNSIIDLTGGFGVDATFFARHFEEVSYVEQHEKLVEVVKHNLKAMDYPQVRCFQGDSISFLENTTEHFNWIYLDPARRDDRNQKMVSLENCYPNVLEIRSLLLDKGQHVLVKLSPMLDIKQAIRQLNCVQKVWVVAVNNECKELLFQLGKATVDKIQVSCIDLHKDFSLTAFYGSLEDEEYEQVTLSQPLNFIYEPNVAILKGGLYKSVAQQFSLLKLHAHSHLYTSETFQASFPGRSFECLEVLPFNKKALLKAIPNKKVNITVRNFPLTVAEIRKKTGLKDGGDLYLFATTNLQNKKLCLLCKKMD